MRNKFTTVLMTLTIAVAGIFATQSADAAKRKVIIEDHTGAWCGFCTRGMENIERLEKKFGERVIAVGVHNSSPGRADAMAVPTYQKPLSELIGLTGFPSGSVNRIPVGGKIAMSDTQWDGRATSLADNNVPVGVKLDVDYNNSTGAYKVTVTATVEATVNDQLAMNLWILEDNVVGSGSGWDQANYLSKNGSAPDPNYNYYNEPAVLKDFMHMNVFRGATGGVEGDQSPFPAISAPKAYTKVYEGNVSSLNVLNKKNVYFVAVVHNTVTKELINGEVSGKVVKAKDELILSTNNKYTTIASDNQVKSTLVVTNEKTWAVTGDLTINTANSIIPTGWTVTLDKQSITVPANGTANVNVVIEKNSIEGYGQIVVDVKPVPAEGHIGINGNITTFYMTENIEDAVIFGFDDGIAPIINAINLSAVLANPVLVSGGSDIISNFPQMTKFKTAIFTVSDASIAFSDANTSGQLNLIKTLMSKGCDIMIASCFDVINLAGIVTGITPTAQATDFFNNTLGVTTGVPLQLLNGQNLSSVPFNGVSGDPISNGITFNYNQPYDPQNYPFYAQYTTTMQLNGKTDATAFLSAATTANTNLNENNNKVGIRLDNNGQRTIYYSFALDPIPNPARDQIIKSSIIWLKGTGNQAATPKIALSVTSLKFGDVKIGEKSSQSVTVSNTGKDKLTITGATLKSGTSFSVKAGTLPVSIDAGQTVTFTVDFTPPSDKAYSDELTIASNDPKTPNSVVTMNGLGVSDITSVPGVISDLFEMTVTPNPIVDNSVINFNVKKSANVSIELIDATGRVINTLFDGVTTGANVGLNAAQLSSGTYYINANVDGKNTQIPVVIAK